MARGIFASRDQRGISCTGTKGPTRAERQRFVWLTNREGHARASPSTLCSADRLLLTPWPSSLPQVADGRTIQARTRPRPAQALGTLVRILFVFDLRALKLPPELNRLNLGISRE